MNPSSLRTLSRRATRVLARMLVGGFALTLPLAAPAMAQAATPADGGTLSVGCVEKRDTTGSDFDVSLCGVTDVDQFRPTLAGNGNTHCGPASLYNVLDYLEENVGLQSRITPNGQPLTTYDPANPQHFPMVTAWIGWLGGQAGMGPKGGGTTRAENRAAFLAATAAARAKGWQAITGEIMSDDVADFGYELAKKLQHAPAQLSYGRYVLNSDGTYSRTGGHVVTVVSVKGTRSKGVFTATLADPGRAADHGTAGYLDTQSSTRYEKITLTRTSIVRRYTDEDGVNTFQQQWYWNLTGPEYVGTTTQFVEGLNWFYGAPAVG